MDKTSKSMEDNPSEEPAENMLQELFAKVRFNLSQFLGLEIASILEFFKNYLFYRIRYMKLSCYFADMF